MTVVSRNEKQRILKDKIADELRIFHINSCYPTPMDEEVNTAVNKIMNAIDDSYF